MKPAIEAIVFHDIPAWCLRGPRGARAVIARLGGQVLSWQTPDGRERLFLSERAVFDGSMPVRGGIPVCFPQFAMRGTLPKHGFLRTRDWSLAAERCGDDYALITLATADDETTCALWPHAFHVELTLMLAVDRIDLEFCVTNTGDAPFNFTAALHSYLRVVQVEDVALEGLYGYDYRDAVNGDRIIRDSGTEVVVAGPLERVYHDVRRPQLLQAGNHSLGIQAQGFPDCVVWNPWLEGCAALPDMPADGWRHMLCVEAAVARQPVTLPAGAEWCGRQTLVAV